MKMLTSRHNEAIRDVQRAILKVAPDDASIRLAAAMLSSQKRNIGQDEYDLVSRTADRFRAAISKAADGYVCSDDITRLVWCIRASMFSQVPDHSATVVRMLETATGMLLLLRTATYYLIGTMNDKADGNYEEGEQVNRDYKTVDEQINSLTDEIYNILRTLSYQYGKDYVDDDDDTRIRKLYYGDYDGDPHAVAAGYLRMTEQELGELLYRINGSAHEINVESPQRDLEVEIASDVELATAIAEGAMSDDEIEAAKAYLIQKMAEWEGIPLDDDGNLTFHQHDNDDGDEE